MPPALQPNAAIPFGARRRAGDRKCAGILFSTAAGDALFVRRTKVSDHAGEWAFPGGHLEDGESYTAAARREAEEEVAAPIENWSLRRLHRALNEGVDYTTFHQGLDERFDPTLNDEHDEYVWAPLTDPPEPLHPGVKAALAEFFKEEAREPEHKRTGAARELEGEFEREAENGDSKIERRLRALLKRRDPDGIEGRDEALAFDQLAFDRESVRRFDKDGRMCVEVTNLSKEQIRPYKGEEIPDWEKLGLKPDQIYKMYCPGEELEKAAPTFNGIQVLQRHTPVDVDDHKAWDIVGTTGSNARFEAPYLKNCLYIWTQKGIDFIESGQQEELSCGYHYEPEMTSGTFDGEKYDGIMRNIQGNHLALVSEGRAGHDVKVADSAIDMQWQRLESVLADFVDG